MDSQNEVPEIGSRLPLPDDIDGQSVSCESDGCEPTQQDETQEPELSFESGIPALVPGEGGDPPYDSWETDLLEAAESIASPSFPPEDHLVPQDSTADLLSDREKAVLDSMVRQAMLSADVSDGLTLPWETGIMASIFGDAPLAPNPELPKVAHTVDQAASAPDRAGPILECNPKRQKTDNSSFKLYERAISFKNTLSDLEADQSKWTRALEKLYTVMVSGPDSRPASIKFETDDMDHNLRQIRVLCGARSPNTIAKRANSLLKFCMWHKGFFYKRHPIPFEQDAISEYVWEKHQDGATYSYLISFVEAVNFGTYVLGLPVKDPNQTLMSKFVKGVLDQKALTRPGRRQARPLTVSEVIHLESLLKDTAMDSLDRYAAGAFLFALYGRCRWSDLRHVSQHFLDVSTSGGKTIGYVEFATFSHKTAAQVARHGLPLPLVAPIWGLSHPCWALEWIKVAQEVGIYFNEAFRGPVLPAPDEQGQWCARSVTASEATKWLTELLKQSSPNLEQVSSHSLKCTTLSWLAKAGTEPHYRLILGHHSTQKGSLETYSRDVLSAPLRALDDVLRQIRMGALHPDLTRSGHIQEPSKPDCADGEAAQEDSSSSSSSGESSSSSDSDGSEDAAPPTTSWRRVAGNDPNVKRSTWGSGVMHQHVLSKIVHLQQEGELQVFYCGMHATKDHKVVKSAPFLESRKCRRCIRVLEAA